MPSDLEQLKHLLFGHEKKALDALTRRLDTAESRTADVADVLPDAITQSSEQGPELSRSLKTPLEDTLTDAITRDPQRFAAALYPVMGPAIRRAIAEAMKSLVVSLNRAIDTSLSPMARIRARRSGLSLAEYVLRESLVFRVDEVYLIDPRSGLLIEHVRHPDTEEKDEDAVSAMLTAIQDFVRDSFSGDDGRLASASVGEFTVWISQGPFAMLAAVIRGTPPMDLRKQLELTVERIHLNHGKALDAFSGEPVGQLESELAGCLRYKLRPEAQERRLFSWPLAALGAVILGAIGYLFYVDYQREQTLNRWRDVLVATPGIVVTQASRDARGWRREAHYTVHGLRDPLAVEPADLANEAGIDPARAHAVFEPYASLESPLILARAEAALSPPDGVSLSFVDGTLAARGDADTKWRSSFESLAPAIAGVRAVDASGLVSSDAELFSRVMRATVPPEQVQMRVDNGVAVFEGSAPAEWLATLTDRLSTVEGLRGSDLRGLVNTTEKQYADRRAALDDFRVRYSVGVRLDGAQRDLLPALARDINALLTAGAAIGQRPQLFLTGYTDGTGARQANQQLRLRRAEDLRDRLVALGVPRDALLVRVGPPARLDQFADPRQRAVSLGISDQFGQKDDGGTR